MLPQCTRRWPRADTNVARRLVFSRCGRTQLHLSLHFIWFDIYRLTTSLEHNETFEQLRVYTTKSEYLGPLSTDQAVFVCCRYGFDGVFPSQTARTAIRCLCNILLLAEPTRQIFVDKGYPSKAVQRMKVWLPALTPTRRLSSTLSLTYHRMLILMMRSHQQGSFSIVPMGQIWITMTYSANTISRTS